MSDWSSDVCSSDLVYMLPGAFGAPLAGLLPAERAQRIGIAVWLVGLWAVLASLVAGSVVVFIGFTVLAGAGQGVAVAASMRSLLHGVTLMDRAPVMSATYLINRSARRGRAVRPLDGAEPLQILCDFD